MEVFCKQTSFVASQAIMTTEDLSLGDALLERLRAFSGQDVNQTQAPDVTVNTSPNHRRQSYRSKQPLTASWNCKLLQTRRLCRSLAL